MDFSNVIVLLSRQRSGTNAIRSLLETHPNIFCFNEVFHFGDRDSSDPLLRNSNFFNFLAAYAGGDVRRILPDRHEQVFLDFMEYLRSFSDRSYFVIDVKYNTAHFLTKSWSDNLLCPYLFDLVVKHGLRVINITRRNYLRYLLSVNKARKTGTYSVGSTDPVYVDTAVRLNPGFLTLFERCAGEDLLVKTHFKTYRHFIEFEYADLFPEGIPQFLERVSEWLGVENRFGSEPYYRKQASLPLAEAIENFAEVERALHGTKFDYFLNDERFVPSSDQKGQTEVNSTGSW